MTLRDKIINSVWTSVSNSFCIPVGISIRNSMWNDVWKAVENSVEHSVGNSVRDSVRIKLQEYDFKR